MDPPLSPAQRTAFEQLSAVTARSPDPYSDEARASLELLRQSGWDVQTAVTRLYDGDRGTARPDDPPAATADDAYESDPGVDDEFLLRSVRAGTRPRRRSAGGRTTSGLGTAAVGLYYLRQALAVPLVLLSFPASVLYHPGTLLLGLVARLFRLRAPSSSATFRPRNPFAPRAPRTVLSPAAAAEQWIRSVEEATGLPRRADPLAAAASVSSGLQAGPSSSSGLAFRHRRTSEIAPPGTGPRLPRFLIESYDTALRRARDEKRVLMVVLSSVEHERDARFKREVLCDDELNRVLEQEDVLVWGGDVSEREAYQVGQTLSYIALPFVAFIALQPASPPNSANPATASTASPKLRLLTRFEPAPSTPLTAAALHTHLLTLVLPRAKPYLARLHALEAQRVADRLARDEAERRVDALARRDEEKVLAVRRREQERQRAEQEAQARAQRAQDERQERERVADLARRWRRWKRCELAHRVPGTDVQVAVRLGDGRRATRGFRADEGTEEVYAWVECELGAAEDAMNATDSQDDNEEKGMLPPPGWQQRFHFRLATTYPRQMIPLPEALAAPTSAPASAPGATVPGDTPISVGDAFAGLGRQVNLVVDGLEERRRMSLSSRGDDSDEDDEEVDED